MKTLVCLIVSLMTVSAYADSALPFTIDGEVNGVTAYFFRGYNAIDGGWIVQPETTLTLNPIKLGEVEVSPNLLLWTNITQERGPSGWKNWNELDIIAGVSFSYANFTLECQYNFYAIPNDYAEQVQEFGFVLSYDDKTDGSQFAFMGFKSDKGKFFPFALQPHVTYYQETQDWNDHNLNSYFDVGIEPSFETPIKNLTASIPMVIATSFDSYYTDANGHNDFFGYVSVGMDLHYDLTDHWYVHAKGEYLYLSADSLRAANNGNNAVIGTVGIGFSY